MNSRPFEGAILTLAVLVLLAPSLYRRITTSGWRFPVCQLIAPASALILLGGIFLAYYCYRVTGHATVMPYEVNRATYGWPENLAFLPPENISLRDPVLNRMLELERSHHDIFRDVYALVDNLVSRLFDNWIYLIGPLLTIPLLVSMLRPYRNVHDLLILLTVLVFLNLFQLLLYPYHLAPAVPIIFCLVAAGCERTYEFLQRFAPGRQIYFAALLPVFLLTITATKQFNDVLGIPESSYWERGYEWHRDTRGDIMQWLKYRPGKHIVLVRYAADHPVNQEWVYNGADIPGSKIIWARESEDNTSNIDLLKYYSDRHAWLVQADVYPQRLVPYPVPPDSGLPSQVCEPCGAVPEQPQTAAVPDSVANGIPKNHPAKPSRPKNTGKSRNLPVGRDRAQT